MKNYEFAQCSTKFTKQFNVTNVINMSTSQFNAQKRRDVNIAQKRMSRERKNAQKITKSSVACAKKRTTHEEKNVKKNKRKSNESNINSRSRRRDSRCKNNNTLSSTKR